MSTKCGWCLTNDHRKCIRSFKSTLTLKTYVCSCGCPDASVEDLLAELI